MARNACTGVPCSWWVLRGLVEFGSWWPTGVKAKTSDSTAHGAAI